MRHSRLTVPPSFRKLHAGLTGTVKTKFSMLLDSLKNHNRSSHIFINSWKNLFALTFVIKNKIPFAKEFA